MNPFIKLNVSPDYGNNACTVTWEIDREGFEGSEFFVRKSPDGERNIQIVKASLNEGVRSFTDDKFYSRGRTDKTYYQVILRHDGIAYYSNFTEASGRKIHVTPQTEEKPDQPEEEEAIEQQDEVLEVKARVQPEPIEVETEEEEIVEVQQVLKPYNREYGIVRQIQKLERLNMVHTGNPCVVLKPKQLGELSHAGLDQDTGQDVNVFGEGRYGQKYNGGFEEPIYTHMLGLQQRMDITISVQTGEGEVDKYAYAIRMLAEPTIAHDDIIVDVVTNTRYAVKKVDRPQFKGVHDVVQMILATAIDRSSPLYEYQVPDQKKYLNR